MPALKTFAITAFLLLALSTTTFAAYDSPWGGDTEWPTLSVKYLNADDTSVQNHTTASPSGLNIDINQTEDSWGFNDLKRVKIWLPTEVSFNKDYFLQEEILDLVIDPNVDPDVEEFAEFQLGTLRVKSPWYCTSDPIGDIILLIKKFPDFFALMEALGPDGDVGEILSADIEFNGSGLCQPDEDNGVKTDVGTGPMPPGFFLDPPEGGAGPEGIYLDLYNIPTDSPFDGFVINITEPVVLTPDECGQYSSRAQFITSDNIRSTSLSLWKIDQGCAESGNDFTLKTNQTSLSPAGNNDLLYKISRPENQTGPVTEIHALASEGLTYDPNAVEVECGAYQAQSNQCPDGSEVGSFKFWFDSKFSSAESFIDGYIYQASNTDDPKAAQKLYFVLILPTTGASEAVPANIYFNKETGYKLKIEITDIPSSLDSWVTDIDEVIPYGNFSELEGLDLSAAHIKFKGKQPKTGNALLHNPSHCEPGELIVQMFVNGDVEQRTGPMTAKGCNSSKPKFEPEVGWALNNNIAGGSGINKVTSTQGANEGQIETMRVPFPKHFKYNSNRSVHSNNGVIGWLKAWSPVTGSQPLVGPIKLDICDSATGCDIDEAISKAQPLKASATLYGKVGNSNIEVPFDASVMLDGELRPVLEIKSQVQLPIDKMEISAQDDLVKNPHKCGIYELEATFDTYSNTVESKSSTDSLGIGKKKVRTRKACESVPPPTEAPTFTYLPQSLRVQPPKTVIRAGDSNVDRSFYSQRDPWFGNDEFVDSYELRLPKGMVAEVNSTNTTCSKDLAEADDCPPGSKIGTLKTTSRLFSDLKFLKLEGNIYVADAADDAGEPGKLARLYIVFPAEQITSGQSFNLETDVKLDHEDDYRLSINTPLPTQLNIRTFEFSYDGIITNPTQCNETNWFNVLFGVEWSALYSEISYQPFVFGCNDQSFSPSFAWSFGSNKNVTPNSSQSSKLSIYQTAGQAHIKNVTAQLPSSFKLNDLSGKQSCSLSIADAWPTGDPCPQESKIGTAEYMSSILPPGSPLTGDIYKLPGGAGGETNARLFVTGAAQISVDLTIKEVVSDGKAKPTVVVEELPQLPLTELSMSFSAFITTPSAAIICVAYNGPVYMPTAEFTAHHTTLTHSATGPLINIDSDCPPASNKKVWQLPPSPTKKKKKIISGKAAKSNYGDSKYMYRNDLPYLP